MINQEERKGQSQDEQKRTGNYKNPETEVNNASYFNDEYESDKEDEMSSDEARSEKDKRSGS